MFLTPILTGLASKATRIVVWVSVILVILGTGWLLIDRSAYMRGFNRALKDYPQNIYNGPTTVVQGKKMGCFPIHIGSIGIGICHQ